MSGFISSSPFQNTKRFLQIQSLAPGIARRSSRRFQLRRVITPNPRIVCQIRGYRCVRLVEGFVGAHWVRRLDLRISGNRRIWLRLRRGSSSPVSLLHGFQPSSSFFLSPPYAAPLSPPPPCAHLPCPCPWHGGGDRPWRSSCLGARQPAVRPPCAHVPAPPARVARWRPSPPLRSPLLLPPMAMVPA
jgi:hypothetical protein